MWRSGGYILTVGVPLLAFAALALFEPDPVPRLREVVFDAYQRLVAKEPDSDLPVRIVAIDEASLARIGQWPWPRERIATLIERLGQAGAAVVVLDIVYGEPDQSSPARLAERIPDSPERRTLQRALAGSADYDARMAAALGQVNAVLGFIGSDGGPPVTAKAGMAVAGDPAEPHVPAYPGAVMPLPVLAAAASGIGAVNWIPDGDSVIRKVPTVISAGGKLAPSLSIEALRVAQGADTILVRTSNASGETAFGAQSGLNAVRVGNYTVDTEADGQMRVLARRVDPARWIPAADVIEGRFPADAIAGRIIFVGAAAVGLGDRRTTAVEASIPGVEVHAQAVEQILAGLSLTRPDWMRGFEAFLLLAGGTGLALVLRRLRHRPLLAAVPALLLPAAVAGGSWHAFRSQGLLVDPLMPVLGLVAISLAATAYHFREAETRRAEVRGIFGRFVTPKVVERLVEAPDRIVLGGETRILTILFSDVRDFTALSEPRSPQEVVSLIRRIHTPATGAVLARGGTVDKFIGDGMMAFWNAPLDVPDHARLACLGAHDIVEAARRLTDPAIRVGVGVHTGEACVGNLGAEQRLEYSALGDAVNLAARIEPLTKTYGVEIIVSGDTVERAGGDIAFLEIENVRVRGRRAAIPLHALHATSVDPAFRALSAAHGDFLAAYRGGEWEKAGRLLDENAPLYGPRYDRLLGYYRERLASLAARGEPWDGVHTMERFVF